MSNRGREDRELARAPSRWARADLDRLQAVLDRSAQTAGSAARETFMHDDRRMNAADLVRFWNQTKVKAMATVSPSGNPHIAPVHAAFEHGVLRTTIYIDAARRRDLQANPRVALTTWGEGGAAVIAYGRAREIKNSEKETRTGASGKPRHTVALEIEVQRVYAMSARE